MAHAEADRYGPGVAVVLGAFGLAYAPRWPVHRGAVCPRHGRGRQLPGGDQDRGRVVPDKERAFATGMFNSGTNVGAIVTPLIVPWIALTWGWHWAFIVTGVIGFVWLAFWLAVVPPARGAPAGRRRGARLHPERSAGAASRVPWRRCCRIGRRGPLRSASS